MFSRMKYIKIKSLISVGNHRVWLSFFPLFLVVLLVLLSNVPLVSLWFILLVVLLVSLSIVLPSILLAVLLVSLSSL